MAEPLPQSPSTVSEKSKIYQQRRLERPQVAIVRPGILPTGPGVPALTEQALKAMLAGFVQRPTLAGLPPRYAAAVALQLPVDLDPRLTLPAVHEEHYWRRVCEEAWGWRANHNLDLSLHGQSWKQAFAEKYVAHILEEFGMYKELPPAYDEAFCRPPIDGTHAQWGALYGKTPAARAGDGKPARERFAANARDDDDLDSRILAGGDTGWPYFERLKALTKANASAYEGAVAWASVDKKAHLEGLAAAAAAAAKAAAAAAAPGGGAAAAPAPAAAAADGSAGAGAGPGLPKEVLAMSYAAAAEKAAKEALAAEYAEDDTFDCGVEGGALREWLPPGALAEWQRSGRWPRARGDSVLTKRAKELQTLLDRIAAAEDHIFSLELGQFPSHLDLELLTSRMPNLMRLSVRYTIRDAGLRMSPHLVDMRKEDMEALVRVLKGSETITSLSLCGSGVDDALCVQLAAGLAANHTVTHLDLSHNAIGAKGAAALAKLLKSPCLLVSLNLANNSLDAEAGRVLGKALKGNTSLVHVDLRSNLLTDEGAAAVVAGATGHPTLAALSLSHNDAGAATGGALCELLGDAGCVLSRLECADGSLDDAAVSAIARTLTTGARTGGAASLLSCDLRANAVSGGAGQEALAAIAAVVRANDLRVRTAGSITVTSSGASTTGSSGKHGGKGAVKSSAPLQSTAPLSGVYEAGFNKENK